MDEYGWARLARLSAVAAVNDAVTPIAALVELLLVNAGLSRESHASEKEGQAVYGAVVSLIAFALNVFNWVVVINLNAAKKSSSRRVVSGLVASALTGMGATCILLPLHDVFLCKLYSFDTDLCSSSWTFFAFRVASIPFQLVLKASVAVIQGHHHLVLATALNCAVSLGLCLANTLTVFVFHGGLDDIGKSTFLVYTLASIVSVFALWFVRTPTLEEEGEGEEGGFIATNVVEEEEEVGSREIQNFSILEFVKKALDMIIRSLLLSGSLWLMAIFASHLGKEALGAHTVLVTLWTLTSYIVDGFADIAQMFGVKERENPAVKRLIWRRLVCMAVGCGVAFTVAFAVFKSTLIALFSASVQPQLEKVWPLLSFMQIINSVVFVYDGIVFSTDCFYVVRNIMLAGVFCWFLPALLVAQHVFHTLLAIWVVKAGLNAHRAFWAVWWVERLFRERTSGPPSQALLSS